MSQEQNSLSRGSRFGILLSEEDFTTKGKELVHKDMSHSENVLFIDTTKNIRLGRYAASPHTTHDSSAMKQYSSGMLDNTVSTIRIFLSSRFVTFF